MNFVLNGIPILLAIQNVNKKKLKIKKVKKN